MEPIRAYEHLCKARHKLIDWLRPRTDEQYRREFPFGLKRLGATLPHMMLAEWAYAWRIERGERVDWTTGPIPRDAEPPLAEVELRWRAQRWPCSACSACRRRIWITAW